MASGRADAAVAEIVTGGFAGRKLVIVPLDGVRESRRRPTNRPWLAIPRRARDRSIRRRRGLIEGSIQDPRQVQAWGCPPRLNSRRTAAMPTDLNLNDVLRDEPNDPGCDASGRSFERFAEALLSGLNADSLYPDVAAHLRACPACREDFVGLIHAIAKFGDPRPPVPPGEGDL